jgi:hypothetical protein
MMFRRGVIYLFAVAFLMIGIACGEDWLEGGYVGSYTGDIGKYFTDPIFYSKPVIGQTYQSSAGFYPGPYGVFPYYGTLPYYSDFRLNSLAKMNWTPIQKNWSETMQYAQNKSSFRTYPVQNRTGSSIQLPESSNSLVETPPTTGDSTAEIVSQRMRGYQVFLDGKYIGKEGTDGDPLDGKYTFKVVGNQDHEIRVNDGQFNYPKTMFFERGGKKIIYVEPGTAS